MKIILLIFTSFLCSGLFAKQKQNKSDVTYNVSENAVDINSLEASHNRLLKLIENVKFELDAGYTSVEHSWDDSGGYAVFNTELYSVGVTAWHSSNFGVRIAHGFMDEARENSGGHYKNIAIDFEGITSFELMYKYSPSEKTHVFVGIGTYLTPTDALSYQTGERVLIKKDRDDDEGYFFGINHQVFKNLGIQARYTHYSQIGSNEYIKGYSLHLTYRF